jgi:arginase
MTSRPVAQVIRPEPVIEGAGVHPRRSVGTRALDFLDPFLPLTELRRAGAREAARRILDGIPASAPILLHFDIDVLHERDMPAAYFPHREGLSLPEAAELFGVLLRDPRIRLVEISEYAALRDPDQRHVTALIDLLAAALS